MYTLNDLYNFPMSLKIDGIPCSFRIYVTAWNKFCMGYVSDIDMENKFFSVVIDPTAKDIETFSDYNIPDTVKTFDQAYMLLYDNLVACDFIDIEDDEICAWVEETEEDQG